MEKAQVYYTLSISRGGGPRPPPPPPSGFATGLSDMRYIETGVLQGSVLGPLLFSIYINDLPSCSDMFKMIMYADDITLLCDLR